MIEPRKKYNVVSKSPYLHEKYGEDIVAWVEDEDIKVFGNPWWMTATSNWACALYDARLRPEALPMTGKVYYTKIKGLGELIHESEFGEECS